ncbi:MAG: amino acid permease [Brevundimonas sp.]|uniref:amino acid permease n=1 Tax=Brevundimonas sp. TaxID=1871086 RepID=UPI00256B241E|nr:amino acid permease [Brevundimonas sp.]MDK2746319.1 amino acid permease [Brevundimonas sp.]
MTDTRKTEPRKLGWALAALLVTGNMIGSGVYLLPASLASVGSSSMVGWVVAAIGALLLAGVFAGLGRRLPAADGLSGYAEQGLGRFFGYQASIGYWVGNWLGNVAIAVAATGYLAHFFPVLAERWPSAICNIALLWLTTFLYMAGPRAVARFGGLSLGIGLIPLAIAAVAGALAFDPQIFAASWSPDGAGLAASVPASMALIFWAFLGFESAGVVAQRLKNPERDVGRATFAGVGLAAVIYIAVSAAIFGVIPAAELAKSSSPFADVAARVIGGGAAGFVAVCAIAKTLGTLGGWMMLTGETARAGARQGFLPRVFGRGALTPPANPLIHGGLMTLMVLISAQPRLAGQFSLLIGATTVLFLIVYGLCCAALFRFSDRWPARLAALGGLGFCGWAVTMSGWTFLGIALAFFAATTVGWAFVRKTGDPAGGVGLEV